jgi:hypothetical protein
MKYIAEGMSVPIHPERPQPAWALERIAALERRLLWARNRFDECGALPLVLHERCGKVGIYDWLQASRDVIVEFCADFTTNLTPIEPLAEPVAKSKK